MRIRYAHHANAWCLQRILVVGDGSSGFRGNELLIFVIYMLVLNVALGVKLQLLISANCLLTNLLLFRGQGSFIL